MNVEEQDRGRPSKAASSVSGDEDLKLVLRDGQWQFVRPDGAVVLAAHTAEVLAEKIWTEAKRADERRRR